MVGENTLVSTRSIHAAIVAVLIGLGAAACKRSGKDADSETQGFRLKLWQLRVDHCINKNPDIGRIANYIGAHRKPLRGAGARRLAEQIVAASECFKVDAYIMTGLIHLESNFKYYVRNRKSGAAGYTQFTGWGVKEVAHQLGYRLRGKIQVTRNTIPYFQDRLRSCIKPNPIFSKRSSTHLHKLVSSRLSENSMARAVQKILVKDGSLSVVAGATLLKTYTALYTKPGSMSSPLSLYQMSLEKYNGEKAWHETGVRRKVWYGREVKRFAKAAGMDIKGPARQDPPPTPANQATPTPSNRAGWDSEEVPRDNLAGDSDPIRSPTPSPGGQSIPRNGTRDGTRDNSPIKYETPPNAIPGAAEKLAVRTRRAKPLDSRGCIYEMEVAIDFPGLPKQTRDSIFAFSFTGQSLEGRPIAVRDWTGQGWTEELVTDVAEYGQDVFRRNDDPHNLVILDGLLPELTKLDLELKDKYGTPLYSTHVPLKGLPGKPNPNCQATR